MEINKLYWEDCLRTMDRMPDNFIDLTVTSPPYDDLRDYNGYEFDYRKISEALFRVTAMGGVVVWVVADQVIDGNDGGSTESGNSFEQALYFKKVGFNLHDTMIYEKNGAMPDSTRYFPVFEYMFVFSKGRPKTINFLKDRRNRFPERWGGGRTLRQKDGTLTAGQEYSMEQMGRRNNIWKYSTGAGYSTKDEVAFEHPAIFPELLAGDHIQSWSNEGDLVYDPMAGSGTVAKISHLLKRRWIISEQSEKYCDIIRRRVTPYLQTTPMFTSL